MTRPKTQDVKWWKMPSRNVTGNWSIGLGKKHPDNIQAITGSERLADRIVSLLNAYAFDFITDSEEKNQ